MNVIFATDALQTELLKRLDLRYSDFNRSQGKQDHTVFTRHTNQIGVDLVMGLSSQLN